MYYYCYYYYLTIMIITRFATMHSTQMITLLLSSIKNYNIQNIHQVSNVTNGFHHIIFHLLLPSFTVKYIFHLLVSSLSSFQFRDGTTSVHLCDKLMYYTYDIILMKLNESSVPLLIFNFNYLLVDICFYFFFYGFFICLLFA